jgi:hypothetical protein
MNDFRICEFLLRLVCILVQIEAYQIKAKAHVTNNMHTMWNIDVRNYNTDLTYVLFGICLAT